MMRIAVVGGTGPQGRGLAYRFALAGHDVVLGWRDASRAEEKAAEETQRLVPSARVVGAFHHVAALSLWKTPDALTHEDVLVCGDDQEAKDLAQDLASSVTGKRGIDAGALRLARQLEPLTAVLISMNKRYKTRTRVAVTGVVEG